MRTAKAGGRTPSFNRWAIEQMRGKVRCRVEWSMTCLPLNNDPICRACYESAIELMNALTDRQEEDKIGQ